jgi:hypothetical protein
VIGLLSPTFTETVDPLPVLLELDAAAEAGAELLLLLAAAALLLLLLVPALELPDDPHPANAIRAAATAPALSTALLPGCHLT